MDSKTLKTINSILFFTEKAGGSITRLKVMKLLWLADRIHLNIYGRLILKDYYCALPHGPIPSMALTISNETQPGYFKVNDNNIKSDGKFNADFFSKSDIKVMNSVWEKFGNYSPSNLRNYSHKFPEWKRYEEFLNDESMLNSYVIVLEDFFSIPNEKSYLQVLGDSDLSLSEKIFHSHQAIQSFLKK